MSSYLHNSMHLASIALYADWLVGIYMTVNLLMSVFTVITRDAGRRCRC